MRVCCYVAGIAVLLSLSSCAKPEYWVKGLTLPPGATVTDKSETTKSSDGGGFSGKTLQVTFECPGGFDKVAAHIGGVLKAQGYTEVADDMGMAGIDMKGFDKFLKSMKGYEHPGKSGYSIMLQSMGGMLGGMDLSKLGGNNKLGDTYTLMIVSKK